MPLHRKVNEPACGFCCFEGCRVAPLGKQRNQGRNKPVVEMMEKRRQTIQNNLEGAEKEQQAAIALRQEYEAHLVNARKEAQQIIETATRLSEQTKEEIVRTARDEAERLRSQAEEQISQAKDKALGEIQKEVIGLSIAMAEKIVGKEMDEKRQGEIIQEIIGQIDRESVGSPS